MLPLVKFGVVHSNGDCSLFNLMELHHHHLIEKVSSYLELRELLATSIGLTIDSIAKPSSDENVRRLSEKPMYLHWLTTIFHGKKAERKSILKKHSRPCEYTDNNGLMTLHTALFLGVNLCTVGTSYNMQDPFTEVGFIRTRDSYILDRVLPARKDSTIKMLHILLVEI